MTPRAPCGCFVREHDQQNEPEIVYCPLHAQAKAMLALTRALGEDTLGIIDADCSEDSTGTCMFHHENHTAERRRQARAILRAVEG